MLRVHINAWKGLKKNHTRRASFLNQFGGSSATPHSHFTHEGESTVSCDLHKIHYLCRFSSFKFFCVPLIHPCKLKITHFSFDCTEEPSWGFISRIRDLWSNCNGELLAFITPQIFHLSSEVSKQAVEELWGQKLHSAGITAKPWEPSLDCHRRSASRGQLTSAIVW